MKGIDPRKLEQLIADESGKEDFNLFRLVEEINKQY
jgi:hypothetical protein